MKKITIGIASGDLCIPFPVGPDGHCGSERCAGDCAFELDDKTADDFLRITDEFRAMQGVLIRMVNKRRTKLGMKPYTLSEESDLQ